MTTVSAIVRFDPQPIDEPLQALYGSNNRDVRHSAWIIMNSNDQSVFEIARLSRLCYLRLILTPDIALFDAFNLMFKKLVWMVDSSRFALHFRPMTCG